MQVITVHCLTVCVDHLHRSLLVFCCLLTACDCSAISPSTTTLRPNEPSSQHVRRLHIMLTANLQSSLFGWRTVRPADHSTVFPVCDIRAYASAVVTKRRYLHDLLTSGLVSSSRQQARHHCGRTYSAGGEIMRLTATSVIVLFNPAE